MLNLRPYGRRRPMTRAHGGWLALCVWRTFASDRAPAYPGALGVLFLAYLAPIWRDGHAGGILPILSFADLSTYAPQRVQRMLMIVSKCTHPKPGKISRTNRLDMPERCVSGRLLIVSPAGIEPTSKL